MSFDLNNRKIFICLITFLVLVFCPQVSPQLKAQVTGQALSGKITSASGEPIPNTRVTLRNPANGETKTITVADDGSFTIRNLAPGNFEITITAAGFVEYRNTVSISADAENRADIVLHTPSSTDIPSEGGASGVSGVVSKKSVTDLPLNGRSASDLAALEPGVATARTQSSGQGQRGFGTQMTISGGRPRQNDSRLDGISVNDYVNGPPGSALGVNLGSDAVEQFTVLSSNYPAQFGRSSGGIIGASTRSGTHSEDLPFSLTNTLAPESLFPAGRSRQIVMPNWEPTAFEDAGREFVVG